MAKQQQGHQYEKLLGLINRTFPELNVKVENLKCPSKDFVYEFYTSICLEFGIDIYHVMKVHDCQIKDPHPELLSDIVPMCNLARFLDRIFQKLHAEISFGANDLLYPTQSRTLVFVSLLINFFIFADENMSRMRDSLNVIHGRKATLNQLLNEHEKWQKLKNEDALSRTKAKGFQSEMQKNKSELLDLEKECKSLDTVMNIKQKAVEDVTRKIIRLQEEKLKETETIKMCEQQIVQSPDVLIHNHKHLKDKLPEVEAMVTQALHSRASKTQTIKHVEVMIRKVELCQANELIADTKVLESFKQQLITLQDAHKRLSKNIDENQAEIHKMKKICSDQQEELTTVQLKWKNHKASLLETLRHLKQEHDNLFSKTAENNQDRMKEMERYRSEIDDISDKLSSLNKKYEEMRAALLKKEEDLVIKIQTKYPTNFFDADLK